MKSRILYLINERINSFYEFNCVQTVMALFNKLFFLIVSILVMLIAIAALPVAYQQIYLLLIQKEVFYGIIGFAILCYCLLKNRIDFFQTLDHEIITRNSIAFIRKEGNRTQSN